MMERLLMVAVALVVLPHLGPSTKDPAVEAAEQIVEKVDPRHGLPQTLAAAPPPVPNPRNIECGTVTQQPSR